jgi:hypothetical protein
VATDNRSLPHSLDGEIGVLSSLIHSPTKVAELCSRYLEGDHFYVPAHQIIFGILLGWPGNSKVEFPWLKDELKKCNRLEEVGGVQFLDDLYTFIPTGANAKWYIDRVLDAHQRRSAILEYRRRETAAFDESEPPEVFDPEGVFTPKTRRRLEIYSVRQLLDFDREKDASSVIGKRWLCRGDSLLISGPTGIGKSTFATQAVIHWSLGRKFFGISCADPQKILVIQSENNLGDLAIGFQDICDRIAITRDEESLLTDRIIFVRESGRTGDVFIQFARTLIKNYRPTIVLVDPLLSYIGGDVNRQDLMSHFLRNGIQPMLNETGIIWIFVHHTGKPPKDQAGKAAGANAYSALGSSEILNWPREVLTFVVRDWDKRIFGLEFRKRARQAGITAPDGSHTYELVLRHSHQGVVWEACSVDEIIDSASKGKKTNFGKGRKEKFTASQLVSLLGGERLSHTDFRKKAEDILKMSESTFKRRLAEAVEAGRIHQCEQDGKYEVVQSASP